MKRFCEYQWKCKEDTVATWTCTAHLAEGHAFSCPYKSFVESKRVPRCEDSEPVKCPEGLLEVIDERRRRVR